MGIAAYNRGTRSIALGIEMDSYAKQGKIHPSLRPTKEPVPRPDTWGDKTREKATAKARSVLRYWLSRGNGAPSLDTLADMVQCDSRFTREVAIHAATTALEELAEPPKPNTVTEARSARLAPVTALDSQWSGNDKAAFGSWNTLDGWSFTFEVRLQPLAVKRETWAATVSFFPPGDSRKWVMRQNFSDRDYAREWCERAAWDAKHDAAKPNGRFGVGALVGAQYRRPSSNQPWHHPRYSGDPADPGHGWTGEVIAYNDPRLWANTLQFPDRTPTQEEVDAHLAHYAEVVRQSPPHVQRALREERVPVLWEYGSASLEDETGLFGVAGPVQRKRNGVRGVNDSVRMRLTRMRDEGAPLIVAMEEEGLRVNQPFSLLMLDEALSSEVMQAAVDALTGEYGNAWEDLVFADGTRIDDPGATMLTVHEIKSKPGGLQGTTYHYDVTVSFPRDGRYKPNGRRQRDDATLDLFAARTQPRLLPAAAQPRMATLEDLATAPLGSLLMTADRTRAYRHATAGKSGWVPQMPSASSPDGWKDRGGHAQPPGLRLFRVLTDMMAREAFYLSPPVFVAAKRNARRQRDDATLGLFAHAPAPSQSVISPMLRATIDRAVRLIKTKPVLFYGEEAIRNAMNLAAERLMVGDCDGANAALVDVFDHNVPKTGTYFSSLVMAFKNMIRACDHASDVPAVTANSRLDHEQTAQQSGGYDPHREDAPILRAIVRLIAQYRAAYPSFSDTAKMLDIALLRIANGDDNAAGWIQVSRPLPSYRQVLERASKTRGLSWKRLGVEEDWPIYKDIRSSIEGLEAMRRDPQARLSLQKNPTMALADKSKGFGRLLSFIELSEAAAFLRQ